METPPPHWRRFHLFNAMGLEMVSGCCRLLEGEQSRDFQGGSSSPDLPTLLSLPSLVRTAGEAPILLAWVGPRRETGDTGPTNRLPHPRGQVFGHICVPFIRPIE